MVPNCLPWARVFSLTLRSRTIDLRVPDWMQLGARIIWNASGPRKKFQPCRAIPLELMPERPFPGMLPSPAAFCFAGRLLMKKDAPLSPELAIVTGASRGIGLAIARRLGRLGARLALCSRTASAAKQAAAGLRAQGIEALGLAADVSNAKSVRKFVARVQKDLGDAFVLVNNAGVGVFRPVQEIDEADWDSVVGTNLKGAFLMSREVVPQMIRRKRGHIIHIASLAGKNTFAGGGAYCASKWGLRGLAGCMAEDLRGYGIRVSVICPGSVHTEFSPHAGKDPSRMLQPDDIAHVVEMLVLQAPQSFVSEVDLRPTQKP